MGIVGGARNVGGFDESKIRRDRKGRFDDKPNSEKAQKKQDGERQTAQPSAKAARARDNYKAAKKDVQDHAERNEVRLARGIGGRSLPDNEPVDVLVSRGGRLHGIEVKTMVSNTNDRVWMNRTAVARKNEWQRRTGGRLHTVVIDDRGTFAGGQNRNQYSGNRLYYSRRVGGLRLGSMTPVRNHAHLRELIDAP